MLTQPPASIWIYLAIANNHDILYIDRAINSPHWSPPYQLRQTDARFEWLSCTDSSLLSPLENVLIEAFNPPLNFRPKQLSLPLPPEITDKIQQLLSRGFSSLDILKTLELLSQPQLPPPPVPSPEPKPEPAPVAASQTDNAILLHLEALTKSMTELQQQLNDRISSVELKVKDSRKSKDESGSKAQPKKKAEPKILKGTASLDEIPQHPENTRSLAKRWGISDKILTRQRQRYQDRPERFFAYSLEKEQGKFGWIYYTKNQLYYALTELPDSLRSPQTTVIANPEKPNTPTAPSELTAPESETKTKTLPPPHTAEQLGERFVNPKTGKPLSAKAIAQALKRSDAQSFADYCRLRDPDGYAWRYDDKTKIFVCIG